MGKRISRCRAVVESMVVDLGEHLRRFPPPMVAYVQTAPVVDPRRVLEFLAGTRHNTRPWPPPELNLPPSLQREAKWRFRCRFAPPQDSAWWESRPGIVPAPVEAAESAPLLYSPPDASRHLYSFLPALWHAWSELPPDFHDELNEVAFHAIAAQGMAECPHELWAIVERPAWPDAESGVSYRWCVRKPKRRGFRSPFGSFARYNAWRHVGEFRASNAADDAFIEALEIDPSIRKAHEESRGSATTNAAWDAFDTAFEAALCDDIRCLRAFEAAAKASDAEIRRHERECSFVSGVNFACLNRDARQCIMDALQWAFELPRGAPPHAGASAALAAAEVLILRCLLKRYPTCLTQESISGEVNRDVKTIGAALKRLRGLRYSRRPNGPRGGETLTQEGLDAVANLRD